MPSDNDAGMHLEGLRRAHAGKKRLGMHNRGRGMGAMAGEPSVKGHCEAAEAIMGI